MLLGLAQLACQPITTETGRITVASAGKISSLDPAQASTVNTIQLLSALGDPLYSLDERGELIPRLAVADPIVSPDGMTVTIPLRRDVRFHDGTPFDAEAMAFSLRRFLEIGTLSYVVGGRISSVEVAAVDRLEPFAEYWGKPPTNAGLDLITLSNSTALYGALRSGEVDVLLSPSIDEDQRHALHQQAQQGELLEASGPATEIGYITLLSNAAPLNNPRLRQALALSINRQEISERVSYGLRRPLRSLVPPSLPGTHKSSWPAHAPEAARDLLRQEGFCQGNPLRIPLTFRSNVPADKLLALTWQAQVKRDLQDCLVLELDGVESTTIYRQLGEGAFKAVMLDWRGSYPDPEAYLTPLLSCSSPRGDVCLEGEATISGSFWTTEGLQEALTRSDRLRGQERHRELQRLEAMTAAGAAYIPVWLEAPRAWSQPSLERPRFDGSGHLILSQLRTLP